MPTSNIIIHSGSSSDSYSHSSEYVSDYSYSQSHFNEESSDYLLPTLPDIEENLQIQDASTDKLAQYFPPKNYHSSDFEAMAEAIAKHDQIQFICFLQSGFDVNRCNSNGQSALHLSVVACNFSSVKSLLKQPECNINLQDLELNSPLHLASKLMSSNSPMIQPTLFQSRSQPSWSRINQCYLGNVNGKNKGRPNLSASSSDITSNKSKLMVKGLNLSLEIANIDPLLQYDDLNLSNHQSNTFPGYQSKKPPTCNEIDFSSKLHVIFSALASDSRANLDLVNSNRLTPLTYCCLADAVKPAALLLSFGASPNMLGNMEFGPLHIACENGNFQLVQLLLKYNAGINSRDQNGLTPLHLAATHNYYDICKALVECQADPMLLTPKRKLSASQLTTNACLQDLLSSIKLADDDPLDISFVVTPLLGKSRLGMSMCPGRNKKKHHRTLELDVLRLKQINTDVLVSLIQQSELTSMNIPDMLNIVRKAGIHVVHSPIQDKWIPSNMKILKNLVLEILEFIRQEKCIVVHCNGGKGRTGLIVVAVLVTLGMVQKDAIQLIRSTREGMFYNPAQRVYLQAFQMSVGRRLRNNSAS